MIIRIRTNYGIWKTIIPSTEITIHDLCQAISEQHKVNLNAIILTSDDNLIRYDDPMRTLSSYQIKHGDLIKITKKLKLIEVENAYIEDGQLVQAGKSYCLDETDLDPPLSPPTPLNPSSSATNSAAAPVVAVAVRQPEAEDPYAAQVQEKVIFSLPLPFPFTDLFRRWFQKKIILGYQCKVPLVYSSPLPLL
jgi:hypothetical protein